MRSDMSEGMGCFLAGLFVLAVLVCVPFGVIWALNTLFAAAIPYTVKTLTAALILAVILGPMPSTRGGAK